jgi:hypothetical protein
MRFVVVLFALALVAAPAQAQTKKTPAKRPAPARKAAALPPLTRVPATMVCPAELGIGIATKRRYCDVLTGSDPTQGVIVTVPPHRGAATLSFELHNRHTYSEELIKAKTAFRQYTATIGVLSLDNTLIDRAVIQSEFRTARDLYDRIEGGAGPGGVKAVAPTGAEPVVLTIPEAVTEVVISGARLTVERVGGTEVVTAPGRPYAVVSAVEIEYRPAPPPAPPKPRRQRR